MNHKFKIGVNLWDGNSFYYESIVLPCISNNEMGFYESHSPLPLIAIKDFTVKIIPQVQTVIDNGWSHIECGNELHSDPLPDDHSPCETAAYSYAAGYEN